jgi:hypothetical protein
MNTLRLCALAALILPLPALAQTGATPDRTTWRVALEVGASFQTLNEVQIPSRTGTRFDYNALTGEPVSPFFRAELDVDPWERHGLRFVYQYLRNEGTGTLPGVTIFAGRVFLPVAQTSGRYSFDTFRATYRYTLIERPDFRLRVGATLLVRDAEIRLTQFGRNARDENIGVAPLLHASFDWRFAPRFTLQGEVDGLGFGQGYAVDLGLRVGYDVTRNWQVSAGWRMLAGGVDNSDTYAFARFQTVTAGVAYRF